MKDRLQETTKYFFPVCVAVFVLATMLYTIKAVSVNNSSDPYFKMLILISLALLLLVGIAYWLIMVRKASVERIAIPLILGLGILYMIMIPANGAPDEKYHLTVAYDVAGEISGWNDGVPHMETVRKVEAEAELREKAIQRDYYNEYFPMLKEHGVSNERVDQKYSYNTEVPHIIYLPSAIGIILGRLMRLGVVPTVMLGRFCNLLVYLLACYWALKLTPIRKELFLAIMCLPMSLQEATAISSDSPIFSMAFFFTGMMISYLFADKEAIRRGWEEKATGKEKIAAWAKLIGFAVLSYLLSTCKYGACVPICLMAILIIGRHKTNKKFIYEIAVVVSGSFLFGFLPSISKAFSSDVLTNQGVQNYTAAYVLTHPYEMFLLVGNSFNGHMDRFFYGVLGTELGWYELRMPYHIGMAMILVLFLLMIGQKRNGGQKTASEKGGQYQFLRGERFWIILMTLMGLGMAIGGMLVGNTPAGSKTVSGVQGRYLTPYVFPFLLTLQPNLIHYEDQEAAHRRILVIYLVLHVFAICCLFLRTR